jgi:hypothetical protein
LIELSNVLMVSSADWILRLHEITSGAMAGLSRARDVF